MSMKMNTLLAKVEHEVAVYKQQLSKQAHYFAKEAGQFIGWIKTYIPKEGFAEDPSLMGTRTVATTVKEQFDWLKKEIMSPYLKDLFNVERTNSKGAATYPLVVDGLQLGNLTALELMRLKSILSDASLIAMCESVPVRSDSSIWNATTNEDYKNRAIVESNLISGVKRTTETEEVILKDPNIKPDSLPANYVAKTTMKKRLVEMGDYSYQNFSGEWTQTQKAQLLNKRSKLLGAVIEALKEVNDQEIAESEFDVNSALNYLFD